LLFGISEIEENWIKNKMSGKAQIEKDGDCQDTGTGHTIRTLDDKT